MTFDHCTFNSTGKVINVYTDFGAGKEDITVNYKDCTVVNTGFSLKPVLNINDSNMGDFKYIINISGSNSVSGVNADSITCSRLFGFGDKAASNSGRSVVTIEDTKVWENGARVGAHAQDIAGGSYTDGTAVGDENQYTDGYKDDAFNVTYGDWTKNADGTQSRTVTRTCKYCKYQETHTENKDAEPMDWDVSKSKTATQLDTSTWTSKVTLSLPSAEQKLSSDVVFVLDTSDCIGEVMDQVSELVAQLKTAQEKTNADIKVGVVAFKGSALPMFDGKLVSVKDAEATLTEMIQAVSEASDKEAAVQNYLNADENFINKGSNLHSGLLGAQALLQTDAMVDDSRKYVITVTDGMTYYWNDNENNVYGIYSGSHSNGSAYPTLLFYAWCEAHNISTKYQLPEDFEGWDSYLENAKTLETQDNGKYTVNVREMKDTLGGNFSSVRFSTIDALTSHDIPYIPVEEQAQYAHGMDYSVTACLDTYQEMVQTGYQCYTLNPDYDTNTFPGLFTSKLNEMANKTVVDFDSIQNDILYAVSAGSKVTDTIGDKFTFGGVDSFVLTVGGSKIEGVADASDANTVNFGEVKDDGTYPYTVTYTPETKTFVWTINENVLNFSLVQLTYTVKLTKPETAAGTYGVTDLNGEGNIDASKALYTNERAVLNAKNSAGAPVKEQEFPKPSVSYTVKKSGGGGGGSKPITIPDDVPTGLNGDDHYAYIVGYPDSTVRPQNGITRAEVATIFFRLLTDETRDANSTKTNSHADVASGDWYNHAVSTLSAMGIVKGSHGKFNPNAPITRAEFAAIAARFDDKANTATADFSDIGSHWAKDEISAAANNGWINGYTDGTFRPNNHITRAEAMTLVNRVLKRLPETADDLHEDMVKWSDNADTSRWYYLAVQEATNSHYYDVKANQYEKWSKLRETRDWIELEK